MNTKKRLIWVHPNSEERLSITAPQACKIIDALFDKGDQEYANLAMQLENKLYESEYLIEDFPDVLDPDDKIYYERA